MDDDLQRPTFCLLSGETIRCDTANLVTAADARDAIAAALELPPERLSLVLGKAAKPGSCPEEVETLDGVCLKDHEALPEGRGCAPAVIQVCILPDPLRQNTARLLGCQPSEMELLKEADLQDSGLDLLPDSFGEQLPRLRKLRLSGNKLRLLPRTFGHLPKLQTLQAEGNDLLRLPTNFGMLRSLQELQLEENNLEVLPASFGSLESLQRLSLDCNHLRELPESFGELRSLQKLRLVKNELEALPRSFGRLQSLKDLWLSSNSIAELPEQFGSLRALQQLRLGRNALRRLPESFGALAALRILALEENLLDELPDSFENLSSLQVLNLDGNCLREVPSSLCLPSLEKLWIGCNAVRKLPDAALHKLRGLKELSLKCNSLQWLPDSLGILGTLEVLYLQENLLEGLPSSLVALKKLRMLWLEDNKLLGLPDSCLEEHSLPALQLVRLRNSGLAAAPEARECAEAVGQPLLKRAWLSELATRNDAEPAPEEEGVPVLQQSGEVVQAQPLPKRLATRFLRVLAEISRLCCPSREPEQE